MDTEQLHELNQQQRIKTVNFVESGCGPMVLEVEYQKGEGTIRELVKDHNGNVLTCQQVKEGYDICTKAGIHKANLVQIVTDDEASRSEYADYHKESVPLIF